MKKDLAVILVLTKYDDRTLLEGVLRNLEAFLPKEVFYNVIIIDGDATPDLSACLNKGVAAAVAEGYEYIHWGHLDFIYDDPEWFPVLRASLQAWPSVLKICSSNSRDEIHPLRIGQEQSWVMATASFAKHPWLWFEERYVRCGGCEDYHQHLAILSRGYVVAITPETTVFHKGAQTRGRYDTNEHQLANQGLFGRLTGFGGLLEIHKPEFFGCLLSPEEAKQATERLGPLAGLLGLPSSERLIFPDPEAVRVAMLPFRR